jgi:transposase InsO family protein
VQAVHERWQMDWKVGIRLGGGEYVHLATVRDPFGAAFIALDLYRVPTKRARVSEAAVRITLRRAFAEWGLPDELQTDGEPTLNSQSGDQFPSRFQLWLIGLGVRHRRIRPGVATDDAEVERAHRTIYEYAFQGNLEKTVLQVQQTLQVARQELNGEYPSRAHGCQHQPPLQAHPELLQPKRRFDPLREENFFDLARVDAYLAGLSWERKVGKLGQINLGGEHETYSVGRAYARQFVTVRFDCADRTYVAYDAQNQEIRRWPARNLSVAEILDLPEESIVNEHS